MATPAHCIYCFENLSAALSNRDPLSLLDTETLYSRYRSSVESDVPGVTAPQSADSSSTSSTPSSSAFSPAEKGTTSSTTSIDSENDRNTSSGGSSLIKQALTNETKASEEHPLFVTWNTITRNGGKALRGCIGTFTPLELSEGLKNYALVSAFEDHRFRQITKKELPTLQCAVTLLTNFEPGKDVFDWELGEHGIRIAFRSSGRRHSATFLPDVAIEQGWDKEETLLNLMAKSGWSGRKDDWQKVDIELVRYRGKKVSVDYEEYRKFREWADKESKA